MAICCHWALREDMHLFGDMVTVSTRFEVVTGRAKDFWEWLIRPSDAMTDIKQRRQSRLLSSFVIILSVLFALQNLASVTVIHGYRVPSAVLGVGYVVFAIAYLLNRVGRYWLAAALTVAAMPLVTFGFLTSSSGPDASITLTFLVLPIVMATIFLSVRGMAILAAANTLGLLLVPLLGLKADPTFQDVVLPLFLNLIAAVLALVSMRHRDLVERDRQAQLRSINEELKRSIAVATEANHLKSEFLDIMSHELRTPLQPIVGNVARLLRVKDRDPAETEKLEVIQQSAGRLADLTQDMLLINQLEDAEVGVEKTDVDLHQLLIEVYEQFAELMRQKGLTYTFQVPDNLSHVEGNADKLGRLFVGLLENAYKFTEHGSVTLAATQGEKQVLVAVADTGVGIPREYLPKLFTKFFQSEHYLSRKHEGTGLGLAISREIARAHGGDVTVKSVVGTGSTFTVRLPKARTG